METKTLDLNLMSLYHLTYDGNDTGYTLDEVRNLIEEHGPNHQIEVTVTTRQPDPQNETVEVSAEVVEESQEES